MSNKNYLDLAEQACEAENKQMWYDAFILWHQAYQKVSSHSANHRWANLRAQFCHSQALMNGDCPESSYRIINILLNEHYG